MHEGSKLTPLPVRDTLHGRIMAEIGITLRFDRMEQLGPANKGSALLCEGLSFTGLPMRWW